MPVPRVQNKPLVIDRFALLKAEHEPERSFVAWDNRPFPPSRPSDAQDASNAVYNLYAVRVALRGSLLYEKVASFLLFLRCRLQSLPKRYTKGRSVVGERGNDFNSRSTRPPVSYTCWVGSIARACPREQFKPWSRLSTNSQPRYGKNDVFLM